MSNNSHTTLHRWKVAFATALGSLSLVATLAGCNAAAPQQTTTAPEETTQTESTQVEATQAEVVQGTADEAEEVAKPDFSAWVEGSPSLQVLVDYVDAATTEGSAGYVAPEDRIAVFDLDGTLTCETCPWCFEYMVFADYALNNPDYEAPADIAAVAQEILDSAWGKKPEGMSTRQAAAAAVAYAGLTPAELEAYVESFKGSEAEGFSGMTRGEAWYVPMLEVVTYLQDNGFDIYVVTATERNIVRAVVEGTLNIDPAHVIGTEYGYVATGQGDVEDGDYTLQIGDRMVFDGSYAGENAKTCKVDAIVREIGKQPVLAFGNSSGDASMLTYVLSENPNPSASFMVLADDNEREYGDLEDAEEDRAAWEKAGYTVFSMRDDFATIYGDGVEKKPVA